jgi:hypothetical protein
VLTVILEPHTHALPEPSCLICLPLGLLGGSTLYWPPNDFPWVLFDGATLLRAGVRRGRMWRRWVMGYEAYWKNAVQPSIASTSSGSPEKCDDVNSPPQE